MPSIEDTAYPRFKNNITQRELIVIYTPTREEMLFAMNVTRNKANYFCFLIMLKTFQRLGYFISLRDVPHKIITHIAEKTGVDSIPNLSAYDQLLHCLKTYVPFSRKLS